jgi:16S rRNA C1402 (ribose-2'-O) methylase RsmI
MNIKFVEITNSHLDEVNGEIIAQISLKLVVEDTSRTSYVLDHTIQTPPISSWDSLDTNEKEHQIIQSLKNRIY